MLERSVISALQFGKDSCSQILPQFDSPLIERVDVPDHRLCVNGVFVESHQLSEALRR
jgi:hypothetical protein